MICKGSDPALRSVRNAAIEALTVLRDATVALLHQYGEAPALAYAVSVPYLHLCGRVLGGALMARSAAIASRKLTEGGDDTQFYRAKLQSARFYAEHLLPREPEPGTHREVGRRERRRGRQRADLGAPTRCPADLRRREHGTMLASINSMN